MNVLDLFSGLEGFSKPFRARGHQVTTLDSNPHYLPDIKANVLRWEPKGEYDVILASPPCEGFSLASVYRHWSNDNGGPRPKSESGELAVRLARRTFEIIDLLKPRFWVVENPVGMMKYVRLPRETIYLCAFGARWKKPTYLWGAYPGTMKRPCTPHESAVRGARSGVQGVRDPALRAMLPPGLGEELCLRMENTA